MVLLNVIDIFNKNSYEEKVNFPDEFFYFACSDAAIQTVYYVDNAVAKRSNAHTKERWAVSGTTKKAYKQKGTGRARHGTLRAGQFRGGGITFGPLNAAKKMKINKNLRSSATFSCLIKHIERGTLIVANDFTMSEVKTKVFSSALLQLKKKFLEETNNAHVVKNLNCLLVGDYNDPLMNNCMLSSRNIVGVKFICNSYLNVVDLVSSNFLVISKSALLKIVDKFKEKLS